MSDDLVKQALAELGDVVRCRCHPAYKDRGLHDPRCECDSAGAVAVVAARIEALERELAEANAVMTAIYDMGQSAEPDHWNFRVHARNRIAAHRARTETNHER